MAQRLRSDTEFFRRGLADHNFEPIVREGSAYIYEVQCKECGHKLAAGSYIYRVRHYIKHKLEKEQVR